ncbi:exosortase system-associated protein, TIGR04073 family, partial [Candidatus Sumerlaeota bacterium]|nr:exosortase system-associated protein, TIGR04073 family [Candidatus Sumerlaeota bacterium]
MRRQRQTRLIGAVAMMALLAVVGATSRASADDETRKRKDVSLMIRKFVRGGLNIVTCWIEIPKNISVDWKTSDPFSATALGAAEGIWWATARFVGGFYEVFSFPFPYPDN